MTAPVETAEFPRTPPEVRGAYVYGPVLHRWFAVSSALLLAFVVWMVLQDYEREWKQYQREFRALKRDKIQADLEAEQARIKTELDGLTASLDAAETAQKDRQADLEKMTEARDRFKAQDHYRAKQDAGFAKAELDTAVYAYEEARKQGGAAAAEAAKALQHWEETFAARTEELKRAEANLKELEEDLKGHEQQVLAWKAKLTEKRRRSENLERALLRLETTPANIIREIPLLDFVDPNLKVQQRVFDDMRLDYNFATVQTVDRCETCHQGIDSTDWEGVKQPYTAHPRLDLYVHGASPHPVETLGCTVCHNGRPSATEFYQTGHVPDSHAKAEAWDRKHLHHSEHYEEWWNRPMLPTKHTQAACMKCHEDAWELDGADTLMRGKRLYRDFGCYGCHKGKGGLADVTSGGDLPQRGPDLSRLPAKTTKGWAYQWIWNPRHFRPSTRMPVFFDQPNNQAPEDRRREETEARAAVAYIWANAKPFATARVGRGDAKRGAHLVNAIGCVGCHRIGDPPAVDAQGHLTERVAGTGLRNQGPELSRIGAKTTPAWIAAWVRDPKGYSAHTRMPSLRVTEAEAEDIAAYLGGLTGGFVAEATMPDPDPNEVDRILYEKFLEDESEARARARRDEMTPEARVQKVGELAIRKHGCAGCHPIPGFEKESKIGVPFAEQPIGSKPLTKLDYGLIGLGHGFEEIGKHGPAPADLGPKPEGVPHTLHDWILRKLQAPRVYDWGKRKAPKDRLRMPNFGMTAEEADCLVTYLLGQTLDKLPKERMAAPTGPLAAEQRGWKVVREHNCIACHKLGLETKTFRDSKEEKDGSRKLIDVTLAGTTTDVDEETIIFQVERAHAGMKWAEKDLPKKHEFARKAEGEGPHVLRERESIGGAIAEPLVAYLRKTGKSEGDAGVLVPPSLVGEGDKVQAPWLFGFLKNVESLRPWLEVRMPSFALTDDEARAIAEFFVARAQRDRKAVLALEAVAAKEAVRKEADRQATVPEAQRTPADKTRLEELTEKSKALEKQMASTRSAYPFEEYVERTPAYLAEREAALPGYLQRARAFMLHKNVDCLKCHIQAGKTPGGDPSSWAPDLDRARTRLRPEWIVRWVTNPAALQPGTKMPQFQWDTLGDLFPGTAEDRTRALKDLLMNLDRVK